MNFEYDLLKLDIENNIATLTFNDPDSLNAMSAPMLSSMDLALDEIENPDNGVRALIVTGAGRGFCAGANVARMDGDGGEKRNRPNDAGEGLEKIYHPLLRRFRNLHCPIVSAVNGPCAGVGMSFARWAIWLSPMKALSSCKLSAASVWCRMAARPICCRALSAWLGPVN